MKPKYKIKKKADDINESVISKSGVIVDFTINDIHRDVAYLEKNKKELEAQIRLEEAKMKNIIGTHPHIEKVSEEDRVATYLYHQSFAFSKVGKKKLEEIESQLEDYKDELEEIKKQIEVI